MLLNRSISILDFIRQIKFSVAYIFVYAVLVGFLDGHSLFSGIVIPLAVSGVVGTALSLLLAFRTSQSYERWWEARTVWGAIVNDSRTLIRQVQLYLSEDKRADIVAFAERQIIWCYALGESLRKVPFSERVSLYIANNGIEETNIPNALLNSHSKQLKRLVAQRAITDFVRALNPTVPVL